MTRIGGSPQTNRTHQPAPTTEAQAPQQTTPQAPTTAPSQTAPTAAPASTPSARPTETTAREASTRFQHDTSAAQRAQHAHSAEHHGHVHADMAGNTVGSTGGARPAASTFATREAAVQALERDYGVHVRDGDASFSTEELSRAHESFGRMSEADRGNLRGLDLVRQHRPSAAQREELERSHGHEHGEIAGLYSPNVDARDGQRVRPGSITLFDSAFPAGNAEESRRTTMHTVLHEAGHAVEGRRRDDAMAESNAAIQRHAPAVEAFNRANDANNASIEGYNSALQDLNRAAPRGGSRDVVSQYNAFMGAQDAVRTAAGQLGNARTPEAQQTARTALDRAVQRRDAAFSAMAADHPARSEAQAVVDAQSTWAQTAQARSDAGIREAPLRRDMEARQRTLDGLQNSSQVSTEQQDFNRFRRSSGERPISDYGASAPAEDYAESYGLYRRDPEYMRQHFPRTYEYFHRRHP